MLGNFSILFLVIIVYFCLSGYKNALFSEIDNNLSVILGLVLGFKYVPVLTIKFERLFISNEYRYVLLFLFVFIATIIIIKALVRLTANFIPRSSIIFQYVYKILGVVLGYFEGYFLIKFISDTDFSLNNGSLVLDSSIIKYSIISTIILIVLMEAYNIIRRVLSK
jgi:uncharacterized membrane protein required for colicin V production